MSGTTPALIAAAAGVGFGHAILPDHWVPLAVIGRTQKYPLRRVARLSGLAGVAHVLVSLLLGAIIIAVGLQFRSTIENAQRTIIGSVLILTGAAFAGLELTGRGHSHTHEDGHRHTHGRPHEHPHAVGHGQGHDDEVPRARTQEGNPSGATGQSRGRGLAAIMVPFGAAASPTSPSFQCSWRRRPQGSSRRLEH